MPDFKEIAESMLDDAEAVLNTLDLYSQHGKAFRECFIKGHVLRPLFDRIAEPEAALEAALTTIEGEWVTEDAERLVDAVENIQKLEYTLEELNTQLSQSSSRIHASISSLPEKERDTILTRLNQQSNDIQIIQKQFALLRDNANEETNS